MIDLHTHILPAVDDGPRTLEGSLDLARAAVAAGTRTALATPHVNDDHSIDAERVAAGLDALRRGGTAVVTPRGARPDFAPRDVPALGAAPAWGLPA